MANSSSPSRILHISGRSDHGGGPEHILQTISSSANETTSFVACPRHGIYWQRFERILGTEAMHGLPHRRLRWSRVLGLVQFVRASRIDIIHSHGMAGGVYGRLAAALSGVPCVHTFHGVPVTRSLKHLVYRGLEAALCRWTAAAVAVSDGEAEIVRHRHPRYARKLVVIPNGVHLLSGSTGAAPPPIGIARRIVSFSRLNQQKNPWLILDIAEQLRRRGLRGFRFDVYGEGLTLPAFRREIIARGLAAVVRPHPPIDEPEQVLASAFAYLSTSRWEGLPLSLLEAWRAGVCVIASDVVGNHDLITHGDTGLLFADGDVAGATAHIARLLEQPEETTRYAARGQERCWDRHCRDLMVNALHKVYRRAMRYGRQVYAVVPTPTARAIQMVSPEPLGAHARSA